MSDQTLQPGAGRPESGSLPNITALDDTALRKLIEEARALLGQRDTVRKREAMAKINALAKEHGLDVAVREKPRRRRKPKSLKT